DRRLHGLSRSATEDTLEQPVLDLGYLGLAYAGIFHLGHLIPPRGVLLSMVRLRLRNGPFLVREKAAGRRLLLEVVAADQENLRDAVLELLGVVEEVPTDLVGLQGHL